MDLDQWFKELAPSAGGEPSADIEQSPLPTDSMRASSTRDTLLLSIARPLMACEFEVLLNQHQYPSGADQAVAALDMIAELERLISVYQQRSELSNLNRFGGTRAVSLSEDTVRLLMLAQDLNSLTHGAFDITSGSLSEVWGFSRRQGQMPSESEILAALESVGSQYLQVDHEHATARLSRAKVQVNPGGIGKGYALDRAVGRLQNAGIHDFMIHGGLSSVVARGHRQHSATGGGWLVALKHPWRWEQTLGMIRLQDQALGTSGSGKQFFHFGGKRYSHIIDPRSGQPAQGMMSATVICPSGAVADALATALFVMGPTAAREFCEQQQLSAILIFADPKTGRQRMELCCIPDGMWLKDV
ncbi:MAG: FAD:protein FMN transferase [Pirellulaceae bacterium]